MGPLHGWPAWAGLVRRRFRGWRTSEDKRMTSKFLGHGPAMTVVWLVAILWAWPAHGRTRRILYNLDGDSCLTLKAGRKGPGPIDTNDLRRIVEELTPAGSQVDTLLVCINAQVMYYPTQVGTLRGTLSTPEERGRWGAGEIQRFKNLQSFFDQGLDPYAIILGEARKKGLEALLTFRMNDAHGNDFLRTSFWRDHPEFRLNGGALDFRHAQVRDYVYDLIREAVLRYDCDGIELDFQRFPTFFTPATPAQERVDKLNQLVERVRALLNAEGAKRQRRLTLAVRAPSPYGRTPPSEAAAQEIGCDVVHWAEHGWIDFLTVSEFLFERYDLAIRPWKDRIPNLPIYGSIECAEGSKREQALTAAKYRRAARHLWNEGASGIYLFNFFTTRENGEEAFEPPFEVVTQLGTREGLARYPVPPWETNAPLITVRSELYARHPAPRAAAMVSRQYVGPRRELREWRAQETVSDVADRQQARWSEDNGRTWSAWVTQAPSSMVDYGGVKASESGWGEVYDPASSLLVQAWLRQIEIKGVFHNVSYIRTSQDQGRSSEGL